jgi:hypothetical protein
MMYNKVAQDRVASGLPDGQIDAIGLTGKAECSISKRFLLPRGLIITSILDFQAHDAGTCNWVGQIRHPFIR